MATTAIQGNEVHTIGDLPAVGSKAAPFELTAADLGSVTAESFASRNIVLNIFPSIDTGVCATSVRQFNEIAASLPGTAVVCVSMDLPFALSRFCGAEGIDDVTAASGFRSTFGDDYGVTMTDGPLRGLYARSIVVVDDEFKVLYTQLVPDISQEPDYDAAVAALG